MKKNRFFNIIDSLFKLDSPCVNRFELAPIGVAHDKQEYLNVVNSSPLNSILQYEKSLLKETGCKSFNVPGFCVPCGMHVDFLVDKSPGYTEVCGKWVPNWRERLECPRCQMNNRQRLISSLVEQECCFSGKKIYFMEMVTPIYQWAKTNLTNCSVIGSEYLGYEFKSGSVVNNVRHEDVESLSFDSSSLDLIVSNDVFEHIPHPKKAFVECSRVLKPGGTMLATIPFHSDIINSVARSRLTDGGVEFLLEPVYHGNPVSSEGSLVFTDFGWDIIDLMRESGFSEVVVEVYASIYYAHLGGGQLIFRAAK